MSKMYRQGDVLLVQTGKVDLSHFDKQPMQTLGPVLALGEVTGHHHTVVAHPETYDAKKDLPNYQPADFDQTLQEHAQKILDDMIKVSNARAKLGRSASPACELYARGNGEMQERVLVVSRPTLLRHEEHPAIFLDTGNYKIITQREYTPQGWQNVAD